MFKSPSWPLRDGLDLWPQLIYTLSWKASTKKYSPQIFKGSLSFSLSTANKIKQILCVICFDTKWLSVLFKTVIIQSDDHNVPHYAYKTTAHV